MMAVQFFRIAYLFAAAFTFTWLLNDSFFNCLPKLPSRGAVTLRVTMPFMSESFVSTVHPFVVARLTAGEISSGCFSPFLDVEASDRFASIAFDADLALDLPLGHNGTIANEGEITMALKLGAL